MIAPKEPFEQKFAEFVRVCRESKVTGIGSVEIAHPQVLGDTYEEVIESLNRLADAGLELEIADSRRDTQSAQVPRPVGVIT